MWLTDFRTGRSNTAIHFGTEAVLLDQFNEKEDQCTTRKVINQTKIIFCKTVKTMPCTKRFPNTMSKRYLMNAQPKLRCAYYQSIQ